MASVSYHLTVYESTAKHTDGSTLSTGSVLVTSTIGCSARSYGIEKKFNAVVTVELYTVDGHLISNSKVSIIGAQPG